MQAIHGPNGPPVRVQMLEEEQGKAWLTPKDGWFATTKGDARLFVLALMIPTEEGMAKKPTKMSLQLRARSKELKVVSDRESLRRYAPNLVMLFGPVDQVIPNKTEGAIDLSAFWD